MDDKFSVSLRLYADFWAKTNHKEFVKGLFGAWEVGNEMDTDLFAYKLLQFLEKDKGNIALVILQKEALFLTSTRLAVHILKLKDSLPTHAPKRAEWMEELLFPYLEKAYKHLL